MHRHPRLFITVNVSINGLIFLTIEVREKTKKKTLCCDAVTAKHKSAIPNRKEFEDKSFAAQNGLCRCYYLAMHKYRNRINNLSAQANSFHFSKKFKECKLTELLDSCRTSSLDQNFILYFRRNR